MTLTSDHSIYHRLGMACNDYLELSAVFMGSGMFPGPLRELEGSLMKDFFLRLHLMKEIN